MTIASMGIVSGTSVPDSIGWKSKGDEKFSVSQAYEIQAGWGFEEAWMGWKLLWNLRVQQRVKDRAWLLAHGRVLMNEVWWH